MVIKFTKSRKCRVTLFYVLLYGRYSTAAVDAGADAGLLYAPMEAGDDVTSLASVTNRSHPHLFCITKMRRTFFYV